MNKYQGKSNSITGVKIYKVVLIILFTTAGFLTSILSKDPGLSENLNIERTTNYSFENLNLEKVINLKENKCRYGIEISVGSNASKSIAEFYNNLRITLARIIST